MTKKIRTTLLGSTPARHWQTSRNGKRVQHITFVNEVDVDIPSLSSGDTHVAFKMSIPLYDFTWHAHEGKLYREVYTALGNNIGPEGYPESEIKTHRPSFLRGMGENLYCSDYPTYLHEFSYISTTPSETMLWTNVHDANLIPFDTQDEESFVRSYANSMVFIDGKLCRPADPPVFEIYHRKADGHQTDTLLLRPILDHMATKHSLAHFPYHELPAAKLALKEIAESLNLPFHDFSDQLSIFWDAPASNHELSKLISIYYITSQNYPIKSTVSTWTQNASSQIASLNIRNRHNGVKMTSDQDALEMIRILASNEDAFPLLRNFFEYERISLKCIEEIFCGDFEIPSTPI